MESNNTNNRVGLSDKQKLTLSVLKEGTVTTLKTSGYGLKLSYPFIISTGLVVLIFGINNSWPFKLDKIQSDLYTEKTITLNEPTKTVKSKDYGQNTIAIKGSWQQLPDGTYYREVSKYPIGSYNEEEVKRMLNNKETFDIDEDKIDKGIETGRNLTETQLKDNSSSIVITIYNKLENEFFIVEEELDDEIGNDILMAWLSLLVGAMFGTIRYGLLEKGYGIENFTNDIKRAIRDFKYNKEKLKNKYLGSIR